MPLGAGDPLGAGNPLGVLCHWVQNDPCLSNDCLGKDGGPGPAAGRSRWRRVREHFYFFAAAHKNTKTFIPQKPSNPVRCTALWTQIDLNP